MVEEDDKKETVTNLAKGAGAVIIMTEAQAQSDKLKHCKICKDKPYLYVQQQDHGKELQPSTRLS